MTDATDVVWVSAHASSLTPKRYHTDADCPYLHKSGDSPTAKSLSLIDSHYEQCQWCAGEMDSKEGSDPREYTSILASADPDDIGRPMTDGGEDRVPVCPECGSVSVREKLSDPRNDSRKSAEDWYCHKCNAHFQRPDERPRSETDARPHNPGSSDLVQRLLDADPEEVGDDERELVTDGGEQTVVCYGCGAYVPRRRTEDIDVSPPDEYYPDMRALCPDCSGDSEDDDQLVTDGGEETTTTKMPTRDEAIGLWYGKASDNVLQWGLQDAETLLLAMQEELGELTQAYLETTHEDGDQERIFEELDDLGALLLQLDARILRDDDPELATDGGERDSLPLEEFSHTTAPEWALLIADDLDLNRAATSKARQFAETHGLNSDTSRRPRSVASGAVYLAASIHDDKRNQAAVAEVADVSTVTVATCYQEIAEAEGLISDHSPDSEVRTDGGQDLAESPTLSVTFTQTFTVQPPAGISDPDLLRDWFFNHYREMGRDMIDVRDPKSFHVGVVDEDVDRGEGIETDGGQEMVLVVEGVGTYNHKTFHTDADCYQIARADGEPVEKPLQVLNDSYQECRFCAGTADPSHPEEYDPNEYKRILVDADPDEVGRPMTDGGQDSVWVVGRGTCGNNDRGARVYHTDRDCPNLGISKGSIHQKPLGVVPDNWDECALCAGADIDKSSKSEPFRALLNADPDEVGRPMTDGGEELVYVISGRIARCATFHRDPDCSSLQQTDRLVEKPVDVLPDDATECKLCGSGEWTPKGGSGKLEATRILEEADPDEVGRPMTDGGEETVWLAQKKGHWNRTTYHTDPDCSRLRMSAGEPISKPISVLGESFDECGVCADGMDTSHTGTSLAARLRDADPEDVGRPMTDGGQQMTTACPECDSARITRRTKTGVRERWRCKECGSQFDEAVSRESRSHNHSTHGTARALEEMDPEDLGDGELVTDGGHDRRLSVEDLTDEQIEAVLNTRGFRKMLAYQKLAEGVSVLADRDEIYESLVTSITNQHGSVRSEESVREVLDLFRKEVETFTEPLVDDDSGHDAVDLEDLYVDDRDEGGDA